LLVSGDITRWAADDEFETAKKFLGSKLDLNPPSGNYVGLGHPYWRSTAIPGNHDQWSGYPTVFGGPAIGRLRMFPRKDLPYIQSRSFSNREVQLIGIDTDADVSAYGLKRLLARGSFQKQLATLGPRLGAKRPDQIRVLVMHHSWHERGLRLAIDRGTRAALAQFLEAHGIQIVLTGHTHGPLVQPFAVGSPPHLVLECRCGTTTQHDQVPVKWRTLLGGFPSRSKWPPNALLVHELIDVDGKFYWKVETFRRSKKSGFVSIGQVGQRKTIV
jgi:hypothetical protein